MKPQKPIYISLIGAPNIKAKRKKKKNIYIYWGKKFFFYHSFCYSNKRTKSEFDLKSFYEIIAKNLKIIIFIDLIHFWLQLNFCLKQIIFFTNHKNNFINLNIIIYSFYNIIKIKRNKKSSKNMFKKKQKPEILKLLHCIIIFRETIICTENLRN